MATEVRTGGRPATHGVIPGRYVLSVGKPNLPAPPGWRWVPLSDVARLETGHTPSRGRPEYWDGDIPWIGIKDATEHHGAVLHDTYQHVTQLGIENSSARILPANTVCLSRTASVGYVVVMGKPMATSQDFVNWACSPGLDFRFLKYVLMAERDSFLRFASGTTHQTIYFPEVKAFHICLPPIAEQRRIADILQALDDKIELNRRMSQTLESMARALFKSWFVDFDPVHAKSEGRDPGRPLHIADLFPASFEESELCELPIGWRVATLGDIATSPRRPVKPGEVDPATPYIGLEHMPRKSIALAEWGRAESVESGKSAFHRGEILFGKLRPYFHKVGVAPVDGVCSTDIVVLTPRDDAWLGFVLEQASSDEFVDYTNASASGTKMPRTSWSDMARFPIVEPPEMLAVALTKQIRPAMDQMISSVHEMRTLATIRDSLLPSLVSGRLCLWHAGARRGASDA
jgi:type I restriction enzyme S subunit